MKIRLQVFEDRCAKCGNSFRALYQSPHDYGVASFVSPHGHVAVAVADDDPIWAEAKALLHDGVEHPSNDQEMAYCFPHLFNRTVDEIDGERLFMWGNVPCPQCGNFERAASRPFERAEFVDVEAEPVTHHHWATLSAEEKSRQVDEAMTACRAEVAALIARAL